MRLTHPVLDTSIDVPAGAARSLIKRGWVDESAPDLPPLPADETPVSEGDDITTPHEED